MRALTIFKQKDLPAETKLKEIPPDEQAILDCIARTKKFVTQRALVTAGASAIPIPGINVTVDVTMLMSILNFINQEFGLTPQQIQHLSTDKQVQLFQMITVTGSAWAGKLITKSLVLAVLKKLSIQMTAAQAAKWVPIAGQVAAAGLSTTCSTAGAVTALYATGISEAPPKKRKRVIPTNNLVGHLYINTNTKPSNAYTNKISTRTNKP